MPQIRFSKNRPAVDVPAGVNLMRALLDAGVPVASSCNGAGVCGKCKVQVPRGGENLSPISDDEIFILEKNGIGKGLRISCQCLVQGDVTVDTSYW